MVIGFNVGIFFLPATAGFKWESRKAPSLRLVRKPTTGHPHNTRHLLTTSIVSITFSALYSNPACSYNVGEFSFSYQDVYLFLHRESQGNIKGWM